MVRPKPEINRISGKDQQKENSHEDGPASRNAERSWLRGVRAKREGEVPRLKGRDTVLRRAVSERLLQHPVNGRRASWG